MAATVARLDKRRHTIGGVSVRTAIEAFLDSPRVNRSPHTRRAYAGVLDRTGESVGPDRELAGVTDAESGSDPVVGRAG